MDLIRNIAFKTLVFGSAFGFGSLAVFLQQRKTILDKLDEDEKVLQSILESTQQNNSLLKSNS